jgi:hypothetical protein
MFLQCMSLLPHLCCSSSRPGTSSGGVSVSGGKVGSVVLMLEEVEGKMRFFYGIIRIRGQVSTNVDAFVQVK